jgi:xanthine/CO dehydrogenase XdhC/CoxF family maturation factor
VKELLETLGGWRAEGADVGRAVVVRTFGSAPRPEGAVLIVAGDGRIAGSVSGGCVEGAAAEEIERARSSGRSRVIRYGISDEEAWDVWSNLPSPRQWLTPPKARRATSGRRS